MNKYMNKETAYTHVCKYIVHVHTKFKTLT